MSDKQPLIGAPSAPPPPYQAGTIKLLNCQLNPQLCMLDCRCSRLWCSATTPTYLRSSLDSQHCDSDSSSPYREQSLRRDQAIQLCCTLHNYDAVFLLDLWSDWPHCRLAGQFYMARCRRSVSLLDRVH